MEVYYNDDALTLDAAAELLVRRVKSAVVEKRAYSKPADVSQAIQFTMTPPQVRSPSGLDTFADPFWNTVNKGLLGAGVGAGGGALLSLLNKRRRKNWLRNIMLGGLLGGGLGGGLGMLGSYGESLMGGTQTGATDKQLERLRQSRQESLRAGQDVPDWINKQIRLLDQQSTTGTQKQYASPLSDRLRTAADQIHTSGFGGVPGAVGTVVTNPVGGAIGTGAGGIGGATAKHLYNKYTQRKMDQYTQQGETIDKMPMADAIKQRVTRQQFIDIFGPRGAHIQRALQHTTPTGRPNAPTPVDAFSGMRPTTARNINQPQWDRLRQAAKRRPPRPGEPGKGGRSMAGAIGGMAGFLLPQLITNKSTAPPTP